MDAVFDVLSKHYNEFDVELKQYASMFIEYYSQGDEQRRSKFGGSLPNDWKGLKVPGLDNKTMEDCLNYKKIVVSYVDSFPRPSSPFEEQGNTLKIYYVYWEDLIAFVLYKTENHKLKFISAEYNVDCVELSRGESEVIIDDWVEWFRAYSRSHQYGGGDSSRSLMPCVDKYKLLRIKEIFGVFGSHDFTLRGIRQSYPKMICPYKKVYNENEPYQNYRKLKVSVSDKLYQYVYDNRFDESVTLEQIKETYQLFLKDMEQYVKDLLE